MLGAGTVLWRTALSGPETPSGEPEPAAPAAPEPPPRRAPEPAGRSSTPAAVPAPARPKPAAPEPDPVAPATGTLIIESDVPDTSVFIDRVFLGTAPVTAANLAPGQHRLNMSAAGYEGIAETIEVAAGTHTLSIKFKEIKLDASIAVVHKHGVGSCAGTLRASPSGLRFDTPNKGDAFTAALTDLETFEVDYLAKNLRVKIRQGKTYTFTDPEGNADRLFVFHRDVEKVRQRLLAGSGR